MERSWGPQAWGEPRGAVAVSPVRSAPFRLTALAVEPVDAAGLGELGQDRAKGRPPALLGET